MTVCDRGKGGVIFGRKKRDIFLNGPLGVLHLRRLAEKILSQKMSYNVASRMLNPVLGSSKLQVSYSNKLLFSVTCNCNKLLLPSNCNESLCIVPRYNFI